jgi:BNR repeat-like domain
VRALLPVALLVLLAGCLGAQPAPAGPAAAPTPPGAFAPSAVAVAKCAYASCYEPTVAADPQGRLFASDGSTSDVGVSTDGGATFVGVKPPPLPAGVSGVQSDVVLQVAPSGRLYWSALVVDTTGGQFVLEGIQVAWSDDGAATWAGSAHVSPVAQPGAVVVSPDRQWLGFAAGRTVYLTYNQIPTGIWIARSDDAGATWGGWTRAAPTEQRQGGFGQSGPPVVDAKGRVLVPACLGDDTATLVFASDDGGKTFASSSVPEGCTWFPILAAAPDGRVVLARTTPEGKVLVSTSTDRGATFGPAATWGGNGTAAPWPLPDGQGGLVLAWYDGASSRSALHVAWGDDAGPRRDVVVAPDMGASGSRTSALTDYASAARLPDGRIAVVWVRGNQALVATGSP